MTAAIKRMLAERAKSVEHSFGSEPLDKNHVVASQQRRSEELMARIDKAAPYIDEGQTGWLPSTKLKLTYWVAMSSGREGAEFRAIRFIDEMLERARKLFLAGLHPNPWGEESQRRFGRVEDPKESAR